MEGKATERNTHNKKESIKECQAYNQKKRQCILSLNEKYEIASYKGDNLLNKGTEILGTYRRKNKYRLKNFVTQKTDVTNRSHNVIKDTIMLC